MELKYTSRGPRLIEINCRMGGGPVRNTNLLVWGVDMVEVSLGALMRSMNQIKVDMQVLGSDSTCWWGSSEHLWSNHAHINLFVCEHLVAA